uniref:Phosphoglycerate mutase n=1 Tax=Chenopodium quinoa TaxID=63459 RepID=A0A803MDH2_CHEQI
MLLSCISSGDMQSQFDYHIDVGENISRICLLMVCDLDYTSIMWIKTKFFNWKICTKAWVTTEGVPTNESCTEFILVRHGETVWNAVGKMQGQLDIDLNEAGRQQAVAVAKRLSREPNISGIYSSDLKRALETAETIAAKCGGLEVICDQDLRERHLGELQGVVYEKSISKTYPKAHEALLSGEEIPERE